jgi:hypothetical protein
VSVVTKRLLIASGLTAAAAALLRRGRAAGYQEATEPQAAVPPQPPFRSDAPAAAIVEPPSPASGAEPPSPIPPGRSAPAGADGDVTRDELYKAARALQIKGRSRMSKAELRDAVERERALAQPRPAGA